MVSVTRPCIALALAYALQAAVRTTYAAPTVSPDPCAQIAGSAFVSVPDALACQRFFPFNETLRQNVMSVVSRVFDFYTFEDYYLDSPPPFQESTTDIRAQLTRINSTQYTVCSERPKLAALREVLTDIGRVDGLRLQCRFVQFRTETERWSHELVTLTVHPVPDDFMDIYRVGAQLLPKLGKYPAGPDCIFSRKRDRVGLCCTRCCRVHLSNWVELRKFL